MERTSAIAIGFPALALHGRVARLVKTKDMLCRFLNGASRVVVRSHRLDGAHQAKRHSFSAITLDHAIHRHGYRLLMGRAH